jgi:hypothetical protein
MGLRVYHDGKPEAGHQLVQTLDEAAIGVKKEMGHMQWHSDWQYACSLVVGISNICYNDLNCCKHLKR